MGNIICINILPRAKARGKICADNVTYIKISNKLTPSINYFYSNRTYTVNFNPHSFRDRPFNLQGGGYGFFFRSGFFFRTTRELEHLIFQNLSLDYMTTLNQIIFFFFHQNQNILSATLGIRIGFFLKKT